jgi:ABC-type multidrug transport system ATPase subunit
VVTEVSPTIKFMEIITENLGKKFRNEWIFRNFNTNFQTGQSYAIIGPNGSGKSTLLQVLSSYIPSNEGLVKYLNDQNIEIAADIIFRNIAICSPFLELIEEFTLIEAIDFHRKLKGFANAISASNLVQLIGFESQEHKQIKYFSSGMKQKVKLAFCLFSNAEILLLDEPTTNLDQNTKNWFHENIKKSSAEKLIIVASNDPSEYIFANNIIDIQAFK